MRPSAELTRLAVEAMVIVTEHDNQPDQHMALDDIAKLSKLCALVLYNNIVVGLTDENVCDVVYSAFRLGYEARAAEEENW